MKNMICFFMVVAMFVAPLFAAAVELSVPMEIKGKMTIKYNSRINVDDSGKAKPGITDIYTYNFDVLGMYSYNGSVTFLPLIPGTVGVKQQPRLDYDLAIIARNPAKPSETKKLGVVNGAVPLTADGKYQYGDGTMMFKLNTVGSSSSADYKFKGIAEGRPLGKASWLSSATSSIQKKALTITKKVKGQTVKIVVEKYDQMIFKNMVLAAGPAVKTYPDCTVNGEMVFDYGRDAWYFRNMTMNYVGANGKEVTDKISGNMLWVESPNRATNGEGEYQFDVRFNEPEIKDDEAVIFNQVDDEAAFFATDPSLSCLTGTAKYKDTMLGEDSVSASDITFTMVGNNINKTQLMNMFKMICLVSVVPMNAE